ncbi:MAG: 1-acyl-sn-glycerol-3-phosphate acyltransferase [Devosiaceae bacterium]|nr:1-acyl-sn-glycerol-3-phosphate acyltransferase [Devosiaceae bacterium MH13]
MPALRALIANTVFFANMVVWMIVCSPTLFLPDRYARKYMRAWARSTLWLLRVTAGMNWEIRGLENIPKEGCLIAAKHQSTWETFALLPYLDKPIYILKKELIDLPLFGWYARRAGMIPVERSRHASALLAMTRAAKESVAEGGHLIIFPEGTRRPVGAPPDYKSGTTHLYKQLGVPIVPAALNSGLFWPRRQFRRHAGTIVISFLPPIAAGEDPKAVRGQLQEVIEAETQALVDEALAVRNPPPLPSVQP